MNAVGRAKQEAKVEGWREGVRANTLSPSPSSTSGRGAFPRSETGSYSTPAFFQAR